MTPLPREHPDWADPPYPEQPPTLLARLLIWLTERLRNHTP